MHLNPEQKEAVEHLEGPLLIFAGAGSGKTRVITHRIVRLIEKGVNPSSIVALSFTNKSAKEMKERIRKMLSRKQTKGLEISTFHSLGLKICEKFISKLGYEYPFLLFTPNDIELLLFDLLKKKKLDPKDFPTKIIVSQISLAKNTGRYFLQQEGVDLQGFFLELYEEYSQEMKIRNALDFDDLILKPIQLLENFPEVQDYYHKKFKYFLIDEFQDTNLTQYKFLRVLMGENTNLCVVGDDDQSIYGFRGSNRELILHFEEDFPNTKVVKLLQNYRSTIPILNLANAVIQNNSYRKEKELWSTQNSSHLPIYKELLNETEEAYYVAETIQNLVVRERYKYGDIVVLFRTNYQSRSFEEALRIKGIPYKLIGAYDFFDRKEVKDLLAYIRVIANPKDELSLIRILN
ncbi:MAG: ATP-dependent helicase, partial [Leptospiraceae bacterium]|nr:ATP-dependent helicase [Leptospiraceae bacterium]